MNRAPNAQYNVAAPDSFAVRVAGSVRKRMYARFLEILAIESHHSLLDVGATSDRTYESSNYLEAWYPHKSQITAVGLDDASFLEISYPGVKFVSADGCFLPFADNAFDFAHSSAVLEHVGGGGNQKRYISELYRVARRGICLTTPNRWFPIEFHTVLPLVHWLPKSSFRYLMKISAREFFSKEENLNLLGSADLRRLYAHLKPRQAKISRIRLGGWTSNLMLFLWK